MQGRPSRDSDSTRPAVTDARVRVATPEEAGCLREIERASAARRSDAAQGPPISTDMKGVGSSCTPMTSIRVIGRAGPKAFRNLVLPSSSLSTE